MAKSRREGNWVGTDHGAPFLHNVQSLPEKFDPARYPFNVRAFAHGIDLTFRSKVTFLVGENGSEKSTLLEAALAEVAGPEGGNRDHHRATFADRSVGPGPQAVVAAEGHRGVLHAAESFTTSPAISSRCRTRTRMAANHGRAVPRRVLHLPVRESFFEQGILHSDEL